jgi:hypothetical protein
MRAVTLRHGSPREWIAAVVVSVTLAGCARLGFTDRVLLRVPSPDAQLIAVCQELPALDGPGFAVRLERPDGTLIRRLYEAGDGDPCSEIAWSSDGQRLAVLSSHVARMKLIDVAWALENPSISTAHWSWRDVSVAGEGERLLARRLHFTRPSEVEVQVCPYELQSARQDGGPGCATQSEPRRVPLREPIVTGHTGASVARE